MPRFPSSTAFRLAAFFSIAFMLLILVLGWVTYGAVRGELRYDLRQRVETERAAILREAASSGLTRIIAERAAHEHGDMRYALLDGAGRLVAGQNIGRPPPTGWSDMDFIKPSGQPDRTRAITSRTTDGGLLIVGADPEAIEELDARIVPLFVLAFGLIAAIGIGGAFLLGRILRRRLELIDATANAIIAGDLGQRVPLAGLGDEFDRLASTLNQMLERIAGLLGNLRQVSGDIAHDLRTPLTRLRQKLELAAAGPDDAAALKQGIQEGIERTDDMLALFTAILDISEVEAGSAAVRMQRLDLSALTTDLAESYLPSVEDSGRTLRRDIAAGIIVDGNRELLAQLIVNLLDNALHHTPVGSDIAIMLEEQQEGAALSISDNGPGIPVEDRERVFDRFTRLERSRSTPGHGLGLSLVAAIARAHGGHIGLHDNQPGVRMAIIFPQAV